MSDLRRRGPAGFNLLSASEASRQLESGAVTSMRLVEDCLARIEARDPEIRAWVHVDRDGALAQARARDNEPRRSPLHGVPIGIKDVFDTWDMPTAYGSSVYKGYRPANDSAAVSLLRLAGAVIVGKCVTTEFASPIPIGTRNPHDYARSPGVSSSGSAAAVADFMVPLALGSQTGGSVILPAAFCGTVGFKASLTGIDRGGVRHLRPTLDTVGLFAREVEDIALCRAALVGGKPATSQLDAPRLGLCRTHNWSHALPESVSALENAGKSLAAAGAEICEAELPSIFGGIEGSFRAISTVEGARAMAAEFRDHLATMNHWLRDAASERRYDEAEYAQAQIQAIECRRALAGIFERCDAIITPSTCGEATTDLAAVTNSAFNRFWTLMHGPCLTIPAYSGPHGMPVGLQVVGPVGSDERTIAIAQWIADRLR